MTSPQNETHRLRQIAVKLLQDTLAGSIEWEETDDKEAFEYSLTNSSIIVDTSRRVEPPPYWMRVINSRGVLVGSLDEREPGDPWGSVSANGELATYDLLERLWKAARDSALKISQTLDEVLGELLGE